MKSLMTILFAFISVFGVAQTSSSLKIGFADPEYIFSKLPSSREIQAEIQSLESQLKNQLDQKSQELETKYQEFLKTEKSMTEVVRTNAMRELQLLNDNLERFRQDAQVTVQKKHETLVSPLIEKIGVAIEQVARENSYAYILNPRVGELDVILYADEQFDISNLVLKKLGVEIK